MSPSHVTVREEEVAAAYELDAVSRRGGQSPGAGLLTGVPVGPVGAADVTLWHGDLMLAPPCTVNTKNV